MRVLVTGASGDFAQALLPALCAHPDIEAVTGIDTRPRRLADAKLSWAELDIRDAALVPLLAAHDALVHLAFVVAPDPAGALDTFDVNVRAAHNLFHAAHGAGVQRLIHMSSAFVYGTAIHANEQTPLKPLPDFPYAEQQAHLEQLLSIDFPHCVRLRPHVVVGPHASPLLRRVLRLPFYPRLPEPVPLMQCVHEDDLASAVLLCLEKRARGAYNIAVEESFSLSDAIRTRHRLSVGVPLSAARAGLKLASRLLRWEADPAWFERVPPTLLINCRRALIDLGWRSRYTAREALAST